ncbi:uncharacterized protein LOC119583068 [Penaeus monodon]|uniref:uncharacterized protein LOC119583068 n=1 Tax=Penaeus monodon TaxID=6687 RepID=UPI0018A70C45|nr:uncharacterized protein LOC119583068 [Penaeus monodon]
MSSHWSIWERWLRKLAAWEEKLNTEFNVVGIIGERVICDKRVPVKLKGKVHKSVVRPAMTYGLETAPLRKIEERKLDVAEMKMLRWMVGVTRMDCIRNNYIRGSLKVTEISRMFRNQDCDAVSKTMVEKKATARHKARELSVKETRAQGTSSDLEAAL